MKATEISDRLAARAEAVCEHLLPKGRKEGGDWLVGSPSGEPGSSMTVHLSGKKQGVWCDWAGAPTDRGDMIGLWKRVKGVSLEDACKEALDWLHVPQHERNSNARTPRPKREPKALKPPHEKWTALQTRLRTGTFSELSALATLRQIPAVAGLELATRHGHLFFCDIFDTGVNHLAWTITDSTRLNAQSRKLDGQPWEFGGGRKPNKNRSIKDQNSGWPIGLIDATLPEICLVEGAPDFLAAWHLIWFKGRTEICRPVAMLGGSNDICAEALSHFKGKTVWMFPHNDGEKAEGIKSAWRWRNQLIEAGAADVDFYDFTESGVKDLNDLVILAHKTEAEA